MTFTAKTKSVEGENYPALYRAAEDASLNAQLAFLRCTKGYVFLSIAGAALALYGIDSTVSALLAALLLFAALGISILMAVKKYESSWYRARALAESVKTTTWRFMMCAEPFNHESNSAVDKNVFVTLLRSILQEHKDLAHELAGMLAEGEQITDVMQEVRKFPLNERIEIYRTQRIDEQRSWYAKKSSINKASGARWFWAFVALQGVAIGLTMFRIGYPEFKFWPTEVFIVAATSIFGWMQVKRFRELAAAYAVAAHEIGLARVKLSNVKTQEEFSSFVGDTENAFSREHTQWIARRDTSS